jgi:DNA-binding NarL/FixJ family response regulator
MTARPTHILIADGSSLTVVGAQTILSRRAETVVLTATHTEALLTACRAHRPELVLLGETLDPDHETLTLVERIKAISPHTRLLLVGMHPRGLYIRDAIAVGVQGYLSLLDDLREGLLTAVEFALRNRQYLSPSANAEYLTVLHQGHYFPLLSNLSAVSAISTIGTEATKKLSMGPGIVVVIMITVIVLPALGAIFFVTIATITPTIIPPIILNTKSIFLSYTFLCFDLTAN